MGRFQLTLETIQSVYKQNYDLSKVEILVIEEREYGQYISAELKKRFPKIIPLLNEDEKYSGGSRNTGLKYAQGKYIVFLDSDDKMRKNYLETMTYEIQKDESCAAVLCLSKSIFDPRYSLKFKMLLRPLMFIRDASLIGAYLFHNSYIYPTSFYFCQISHMIFRSKYIKNLRFNADYIHGGEDWDFFVQLLKIAPFRILPKRLLIFRYSRGSSTDTPINRERKWKSYTVLGERLPDEFKRGIYYWLFLRYINIFGGKFV